MLRWLFLVLLFTFALYGSSDSEILKEADSLVKSSDKSKQFRAYNEYKNLYLKAIIAEDEYLRVKSLQGIVKSGHKLHIDVSKYSNELLSSKHKTSHLTPKLKVKKDDNSNIKVNSSNKLESIKWDEDNLILEFEHPLTPNQVNYFTLYDSKKKQFKYVFDIHASMLTHSKTIVKEGVKRIKVGQYKTNTLRLVIENDKKLDLHYYKTDASVKIALNMEKSAQIPHARVEKPLLNLMKHVDRNKIIVIDAGHGGKDPGAIGYRHYQEKDVVFNIAKKLRNLLKKRGYKVYMTRNRDVFVKLSHRTRYANRKKADLFISIHANAISGSKARNVSGIEAFFLSTSRSSRAEKVAAMENSADISEMNYYGKQSFLTLLNNHKILASNKLAIDLQRGMLEKLNKHYRDVTDAGVREGPFWVLVGAQMPSVLIEVGFISNPEEAKRLVSSKYQQTMAVGMANGIERYFMHNN